MHTLLKTEEIESYHFGNPVIDEMENYNYILRGMLINREITSKTYLKAEEILAFVASNIRDLPASVRRELKEALGSL